MAWLIKRGPVYYIRYREILKVLQRHGIPRDLAKKALESAERQGRFTIFSLVDALTRHAGEIANAGDRLEADERAGRLLALAAAD